MSNFASANPSFHALLIGCDFYFRNVMPNGKRFQNLTGCVRDIRRIEKELLVGRLGVPAENILKLTASDDKGPNPTEPPEQWPTYDNIVKKFAELTERAQPGDQVYIHYSGHGGRVRTRFPHLKGGDNEVDETLVPIDIANVSTRHVRDIDLAYVLQKMVDKGLVVTLVLDSCHSGGATRNAESGDVAVRHIPFDDTERPTDSSFASDEELAANWEKLTRARTRNASVGGGWLPEPEGYVLLAACLASQSALEYAFSGSEKNGVLTYWLLEAYKQLGPKLTWKMVHDRIMALVHSQFPSQTPQLQGEKDRVVFGIKEIPRQYAINVLNVDDGQRVLLNTGQALGVTVGDEFAIYPAGTIDFTETEARLATAEVETPGATESWAKITEEFGQPKVEPGAQALMIDAVRIRRKVRLLREEQHLTDAHRATLEAVERSIREKGSGFVELTGPGDAADYQVGIAPDGKDFQILDPQGMPFANLSPALRAETGNAQDVVKRLVHLSRYHTIYQLRNYDTMSKLAGKVKVELFGVPPGYQPGDRPDPTPLKDPGNTPTIKDGEMLLLNIRNESTTVLNVAVLDLQPDWGISQFYPTEEYGEFIPIDGGKDVWVLTEFYLMEGIIEGMDLLKVFATVGPASFRCLQLPKISDTTRRATDHNTRSGLGTPLERLLAAISADAPTTRDARPSVKASDEWVTTEVAVRVKRLEVEGRPAEPTTGR